MSVISEINRLLAENGYTQTKIATELGISKQRVNNVLQDKSAGLSIKMKVGDIIGVPAEMIWPKTFSRRMARRMATTD